MRKNLRMKQRKEVRMRWWEKERKEDRMKMGNLRMKKKWSRVGAVTEQCAPSSSRTASCLCIAVPKDSVTHHLSRRCVAVAVRPPSCVLYKYSTCRHAALLQFFSLIRVVPIDLHSMLEKPHCSSVRTAACLTCPYKLP